MKTDLIQCLEEYYSLSRRGKECMEEVKAEPYSEDGRQIHSGSGKEILPAVNEVDRERINMLIRRLRRHPELRDYHLETSDLAVISGIYQRTRENCDLDLSFQDIIGFSHNTPEDLKAGFEYLLSLVDRGIISFTCPPEQEFHANLGLILQSQYRLNGLVWNILLGKSPFKGCEVLIKKGFKGKKNPLEVICDALELLFSHYPELSQESRAAIGVYYGKAVNRILDLALEKISTLDPLHWLSKFIAAHSLDSFWQKCLMLIYFHQCRLRADLTVSSLAVLISSNLAEYRLAYEEIDRNNVLKREGLLENSDLQIFSHDISLNDQTLSDLTSKHQETPFDLARFVSDSPYFSMIEPRQTLDQLILPRMCLNSVNAIITRLRDPRPSELAQWGLLGASLTGEGSAQEGCNVLLHGAPGTGKTYIAGVLANELSRPLLMINANDIRNCYYGSTEKRARSLFREMRQIAREVNPVFLLNEGDQLIHRRNDDTRGAADNTENSIQSVFLEEMETFPGILIVTTNLLDNLDPAMSRRFQYKLEIPIPDYPGRLKLWRLHLPDTIPGASQIDIEALAAEFPFTGGQIRNVVLNACHEACSIDGSGSVSQETLQSYASLENSTNFETKVKTVGFCRR